MTISQNIVVVLSHKKENYSQEKK